MITISTNARQVAKGLDISARELKIVMGQAVKDIEAKTRKDFERTTTTWQRKPEWFSETNTSGGKAEALIGTDNAVWNMLDKGTRPHEIVPKNAKALAFRWGGPGSYRAKTTPGGLQSGAGGQTGSMVYRQRVWHPGTKPRRWSRVIQKRVNKYAPRAFDKYLRRWAKRAKNR